MQSTMSIVLLKAMASRSLPSALTTCPMMASRRCKHTIAAPSSGDGANDESTGQRSRSNPAKANADLEDGSSVPKVLLLGLDNNRIGLMSFANAESLAKHKDLKMVHVEDSVNSSTGPQVYKLMTSGKLQAGRLNEKQRMATSESGSGALTTKGLSTLIVGSRIEKHDLQVKMKTIQRWLSKGQVVRVTINGDQKTASNMEKVCSDLEKAADEVGAQALQKRKDDEEFTIKFTLQLSKKKVEAMKKKQQADCD